MKKYVQIIKKHVRIMKKHHTGDLFTIMQVIITAFIVIGTWSFTLETVIFLFAAAELCDAIDGPCAKRWKYPKDGKYRWWRTYASEIDKITDLMTGCAMIIYTIARVNSVFGWLELLVCTIIGIFIQMTVYDCRGHGYDLIDKNEQLALKIIHIRRFVYVVNILGVITYLIWQTVWSNSVKGTLTLLMLPIGLFLLFYKRDRLRDR